MPEISRNTLPMMIDLLTKMESEYPFGRNPIGDMARLRHFLIDLSEMALPVLQKLESGRLSGPDEGTQLKILIEMMGCDDSEAQVHLS
jgi:hypothetical protein